MTDLHAALLEAITARQKRAQRATPGRWEAKHYGAESEVWSPEQRWVMLRPVDHWGYVDGRSANRNRWAAADCDHSAAESPDAVLRQCERDLSVLNRHRMVPAYGWGKDVPCCELEFGGGEGWIADWPCEDIRDLAEAYAIPVEAVAGQTPGGGDG